MALTLQQLKEGAVMAAESGDMDSARKFMAAADREEERQKTDEGAKWELTQGQQPVSPETIVPDKQAAPSVSDRLVGAGETALTLATGATTGMLGSVGGTVSQAIKEASSGQFGSHEAAQRIQQAAESEAMRGTYLPRTPQGLQTLKATGEALSPLSALPPVAAELNMVSAAARQASGYAPVVKHRAMKAAQAAGDKVQGMVKKLPDKMGADGSVGAAQNPKALVRKSEAEGLLVPIKLTRGEADRENFDQRRFEEEVAKTESGELLRERRAESNLKLQQNFDAMIDDVGSMQSEDIYGIGDAAVSSLRNSAAKSKNAFRGQYKKARDSGGLKENIDLNPLADYLNKNRAERAENSIMTKVQRQLETLDVADGDFAKGSLKIGKISKKSALMGDSDERRMITINQAEAVRRFINKNVNSADPNDIRIAAQMKSLIDDITETAGNSAWKKAHKMRREHAQKFENVSLIKNMLGSKRGTEERSMALEDVLNKSVLQGSAKRDNLLHLKKLLKENGEDGEQAWKEIQGGTLAYIREKSLQKGTDTQGNAYFSAAGLEKALASLEKTGKLDIVFDGRTRNNLQLLRQVSKYVMTAPTGVVNSSNTATVLGFLADMALLGTAGVPVPIVSAGRAFTQRIKDQKLKRRIQKALNIDDPKDVDTKPKYTSTVKKEDK